VYVVDLATPGSVANPFAWSAMLTALAFLVVGGLKARVVEQTWWRSAFETLAIGGAAAGIAFLVGVALEGVG
jgi:VIT1/CCC1 family predicted Fe2+/Mn2+ transporter